MTRIINDIDDFLELKGSQLGVSQWFNISQDVIDKFAEATFDHQWIHVDVEKAKKESEYSTTIAHGYLTLSLLPFFLEDIIKVNNLKKIVNYGIKKMIYKNVVKVNSRIRLSAFLKNAKDLGNICETEINCKFDIEGSDEPALEGSIIYIYYFNNNNI